MTCCGVADRARDEPTRTKAEQQAINKKMLSALCILTTQEGHHFPQTHSDVGSIDSTLSLNGSSSRYKSREDSSDTHSGGSLLVFVRGLSSDFAKRERQIGGQK